MDRRLESSGDLSIFLHDDNVSGCSTYSSSHTDGLCLNWYVERELLNRFNSGR